MKDALQIARFALATLDLAIDSIGRDTSQAKHALAELWITIEELKRKESEDARPIEKTG